MNKFDLKKFVERVQEVHVKNSKWREGQTLFNTLHIFYPELSEEIRGDQWLDPYYSDENINNFWSWLAKQ